MLPMPRIIAYKQRYFHLRVCAALAFATFGAALSKIQVEEYECLRLQNLHTVLGGLLRERPGRAAYVRRSGAPSELRRPAKNPENL